MKTTTARDIIDSFRYSSITNTLFLLCFNHLASHFQSEDLLDLEDVKLDIKEESVQKMEPSGSITPVIGSEYDPNFEVVKLESDAGVKIVTFLPTLSRPEPDDLIYIKEETEDSNDRIYSDLQDEHATYEPLNVETDHFFSDVLNNLF